MSFFGFDTSHNALEREKEKLRERGLGAQEDVAVYNWGESDYDGLGDALQEGGDELNDETFGGSDPVGKNVTFTCTRSPLIYMFRKGLRLLGSSAFRCQPKWCTA